MSELSRTLVRRARITMPFCANTFSVAPCTATGTPCFNTKATCKDLPHYNRTSKVYAFSSADSPVPFPGPRPYLKAYTPLTPEIKDELTVSGRLKLTLYDEPDGDVGIDPYVTQRPLFPEIPGTFWRKLVARNPRYKGAPVVVDQGELGDPEEDFIPCGAGILDTISFNTDGTVTVEVLDQLQALKFTDIPPTLYLMLAADINESAVTCFLTGNSYADNSDVAKLPVPGWIQLDDEILHYTAIDLTTGKVTLDKRGEFGTTATSHTNGGTVQPIRYFPPQNPFDAMQTILLEDAGYAEANVNVASFQAAKDWYPYDVPVTALLTSSVEARTLFLELVGLFGCRAWVDEEARITITRLIPNQPGLSYPILSDAANFVSGSQQLDMGDASSTGTVVCYGSGVVLYWDKKLSSDSGDTSPATYNAVLSYVDPALFDAQAEEVDGQSGYSAIGLQLKKIYSRWLGPNVGLPEEDVANGVNDVVWRLFREVTQPHPVVTSEVMVHDAARKVGEFVDVHTRLLCNPDGTDAIVRSVVIKKEPKGATIGLKLQRLSTRRYLWLAPEELAGLDWSAASPEERQYGFLVDETGRLPDGSEGFYLW